MNAMMSAYTTEALVRALAPINVVIDSFLDDAAASAKQSPSNGINSQGQFVSMLISISQQNDDVETITHPPTTNNDIIREEAIDWTSITFLPSRRYVHKLVQRYTSRLEGLDIELEDDNLASLVCHFSMSKCSSLPDPTSSSIVTFRIPRSSNVNHNDHDDATLQSTNKTDYDSIVLIRTYPHHNDVGVAKVWEAGACLAEYLMHNPQLIQGKHVVELGAGVGLTGLVVAIEAKSVHMTDYSEVILDNLAYNVCDNGGWLSGRGVCRESVTVVSMN